MRAFYGTACLLLVLLAGYLGVCNARYKAMLPEKALRKTPKEADFKADAPKGEDRGAKLPEIKTVWEKDVFAQGRGSVEKQDSALAAARQVDLELIGICKFGETSGAVIGSKSRGQLANAPGAPPGAQGAEPKSGRKFYTVGQRLGNGYMLKDVQSDKAILSRGSEELVLKIQFESDSSKGRRLASVSFKAAEPPQGPPAQQGAPPEGAQQPASQEPKAPAKALPKPPTAPPMAPKRDVMT